MPVNYTIDDSEWSTPNVTLSLGWNMLQTGGDNEYINMTQVDAVTPLLSAFHNESLSWTTTLGANATLSFVGTDIWAYGVAGPDQGAYSCQLDGGSLEAYTAQTDASDAKYLMFAAHGLDEGVVHKLVLANGQQGASLAFDYAIVQRCGDVSPTSTVSTAAAQTSASESGSDGSALSGLLNATSPDALSNLTGSSQTTYSAQQLALLGEGYHFHWTPSAYFVVIFASVTVAIVLLSALYRLTIALRERRTRSRLAKQDESYLVTSGGKRPRPTTRLLDALRRGNISNPVPSEDGDGRRRSSQTTATFVGSLGKGGV